MRGERSGRAAAEETLERRAPARCERGGGSVISGVVRGGGARDVGVGPRRGRRGERVEGQSYALRWFCQERKEARNLQSKASGLEYFTRVPGGLGLSRYVFLVPGQCWDFSP